MDEFISDKGKSHNRTFVIIYSILGLFLLVGIGLPVFQSQYIYPSFVKQLLENTENEAVRTARHMMRTVLKDSSDGKIYVSDKIKTFLENSRKDYNLWKIKIFSNSGETIYSTSKEDIGWINKKLYFHDIVAKGKPYSKVAKKNTKSLEGQVIINDIVEVYVPMMNQSEFIGAFELYYNITVQKESMDKLISRYNYILYTLAFIIIIVVLFTMVGFRKSMKERQHFENALFEMANTDKLTGIYNRRRFGELLRWELKKYGRYQRNACLLLFDLDHFKKVNDTYGHQVGDDVLVAIAQICKTVLRKIDIFGRYGGEEFIAFLPETDREGALVVAERLRGTIESASIPSNEGPIHITISIGIAPFGDIDELSIDSVIKQADDALYSAKNRGRNRVFCIHQNA